MKKVLILEDEVNIRSFVVINLRRAGYDVIEAGTGQEALDRLNENPDIGVSILDIMISMALRSAAVSGPPTSRWVSLCSPPEPRRWTR